jgi:branched-chain amino acid transport system ATP-binding protein
MTNAIEAKGLSAGYFGRAVVHALDLVVRPGEVVALLGPNGAGKTTTLLALCGELAPMAGEVYIDGKATAAPLHLRSRRGLGFVPEERAIFPELTVTENLRVGKVRVERAIDIFPELKARLRLKAGLLSGGEQQMLVLARALGRNPKVLFADEFSLGLAPLIVDRLLQTVREAADNNGTAVLLVEQYASKALRYADRAYVLRRGTCLLSGSAVDLRGRLHDVEEAYLTRRGA